MPDGILEDLRQDHQEFIELIERTLRSDAAKDRTLLFEELLHKLLAHQHAEQDVLYARLEKSGYEEARNFAYEGENEHQIVEHQLQQMWHAHNKISEQWSAQATVLRELVSHHAAVEERAGFAWARRQFDAATLGKMGEEFLRLKDRLLAEA